jgi:Tfp pilus assembly protein PilF
MPPGPPGTPQATLQQAVSLHQQGLWPQAQSLYEDLLRQHPGHFDALHLLGVIALQVGNPRRAAELISQAIAIHPGNPAFHSNLGNARRELGQLDAALASFDQAIAQKPDFAEAHSNRGNVLLALGQPDAARASYEKALSLRPDYAEAWSNRGNALQALGHLQAALASHDRAIALRPGYADAHYNRGTVLKDLKRPADAVASYDQALRLRPDHADAHYNRGNALKELDQLDAALASYERALQARPGHAEAHANRGATLLQLGQVAEAIASYDQALRLQPDLADAHWNRSLALLLAGDFARGWPGYEWRWKLPNMRLKPQRIDRPPWLGGEPLRGRTLLLHSEQGLGDAIQFCRYARLAADQGARVILQVPQVLAALMQRLHGVAEVVTEELPLPGFDLHCPLLSLPLAFRTGQDTIPGCGGYLASDPGRRAAWAARLGPRTGPRIGLVWSGSTGHLHDRQRSLRLAELLPHLPAGLDCISLQKEVRETDQAALQASGIRHVGTELQDFADTAALCDLVDLVISVDTSVAHLAGALGRPTWVLLPRIPDWRWMLGRDDSPWYASVTLYRQGPDRHWGPVLERLGHDLRRMVQEGQARPAPP